MPRRRVMVVLVALLSAFDACPATSLSDFERNRIKPYSRNPSYWQYRGRPLLLIGGSDRDNIFQWALDGTKLTDHLDLLVACGGNYIR